MKTRTIKSSITTAFLALLFAGVSYGQGGQNGQRGQEPPTVDEIFAQLDKDEDGKLAEKEVKGPLKDMFAEIDTNEDGFLSKEEIEKAPKPKGRKGKQ
ncbi:EF-hand domain-containing protein [uncultured Kriegella sp.]|uniref:EF-hand domain-containing protein n=1 Tax=uncultured Kriegella sp. TaxID=1798910 RepID=UPI0030DB0E80|tara:strand:+ start:11677 stop:11970 length:294 start_codon:yes stop_codon:yes gene_type:complete